VLRIRNISFRSAILNKGSGSKCRRPINYESLSIKYFTFFLNFFTSLINSKDPDPDLEPNPGQLITDPLDPDPVRIHNTDYELVFN